MSPTKLHIYLRSDPSAGTWGEEAKLDVDLAPFDPALRARKLEELREGLAELFGRFWDDRRVFVLTEQERDQRIEHGAVDDSDPGRAGAGKWRRPRAPR